MKEKQYTIYAAAQYMRLSTNDIKVHIHRGNLKARDGKIDHSELKRFKQALPSITLQPIPDKFKKCFWLWHGGYYTSVLAENEQEALTIFQTSPRNKGKEVYAVWAV